MLWSIKVPDRFAFEELKTRDRPAAVWCLMRNGFGDDVMRMTAVISIAIERGYDFYLHSKRWVYAPKGGWRTYFQPFCAEIDCFPLRYTCMGRASTARATSFVHRSVLRTFLPRPAMTPYEGRAASYALEYSTSPITCSLASRPLQPVELMSRIARKVYSLNADTQEQVSARVRSLDRADHEKMAAFHLRRGDKVSAHSPADFAYALRRYESATGTFHSAIFLATDNYHLLQEVQKLLPDRQILCTANTDHTGHRARDALRTEVEAKHINNLRLFVDVEVTQQADVFICCQTSDLSRLITLLRGEKPTIMLGTDKQTLFRAHAGYVKSGEDIKDRTFPHDDPHS